MAQDPWAEFRNPAPATARPTTAQPTRQPPQPVLRVGPTAQDVARDTRDAEAASRDQGRFEREARGETRAIDETRFRQTQSLRDQYLNRPEVREYSTIIRQFAGAVNSPTDAAGDQALITAYAKMLDPASVVREGEYATTAEADNTLNQLRVRIEREFGVDEAGRLSPLARQRLIGSMRNLAVQSVEQYDMLRRDYTQMAERNGIDPFEVIGTHLAAPYVETLQQSDQRREQAATSQGGGSGPSLGTTTEEESATLWGDGQPRFNANGEPVGTDYQGPLFLRDGTREGTAVRVTADRDPTANMGFLESLGEAITGNARSTPEIEALPDWAGMPEMNQLSLDSLQAALGTAFGGGPEEIANILQSQFPGMSVRRDANGNFILRSTVDGQEYGIRPGFRVSDIPRALGVAAAFTPAGRAASVGGTAAASAATQAGIEATQAATGGSFDTADVAMAGGTGGAFRAAEPYVASAARTIRNALPLGRRAAQQATQAGTRVGPPTMAEGPAAAPVEAAAQQEVGSMARAATGVGPGARSARQNLAEMARPNPEAASAADRLGADLPVDVLSDSQQVRSLAGLTRSEAGSEAEAAWRTTLERTARQADEALAELGATPNLAQVSDDVLARMNGISESLGRQASGLREQVNAAIRPSERVDTPNLQELLANLINDYGGLKEAKLAMTTQERELLAMLGEGDEVIRPTYARLNRLRDDIGDALSTRRGPWADVNESQLRAYYNALRDDQLAAVEAMAGPEIATAQRQANAIFAEMYRQREATEEVFGRQLDRSLATIMNRAVSAGSRGDAREISRVMSRIPEDMRGPAVVSAMMAQARTRAGAASEGAFSFANYAKTYRGLRQNGPIYAEIARAVGPHGERVLNDLFVISNRLATAEANVLKTGKANQVLSATMQADGILRQVFDTATRRAGAGVGAAVGSVAGPTGAVAGATLGDAVQGAIRAGGNSRLQSVHNLLNSPEFRTLVDQMAAGRPVTPQVLWNSPAFHRLGKSAGLTTPEARREWLARLAGAAANSGRPGATSGPQTALPLAAEDRNTETETARQVPR